MIAQLLLGISVRKLALQYCCDCWKVESLNHSLLAASRLTRCTNARRASELVEAELQVLACSRLSRGGFLRACP